MVKPARFYTIKSDGTVDGVTILDPDGKKLGLVTSLNIEARADEALVKARIGVMTKADVKVLEEYVEVVEIDILQQKLKEAEDKLEKVEAWMYSCIEAEGPRTDLPPINPWPELKDILGVKPQYMFREGPGMAWGNLDGKMVPLTPETRRVARHMTFGEMLGYPKCSYTQKDYEEIEDHCCEGSDYHWERDYELYCKTSS